MVEMHPEMLSKDGKKFAVVPHEEFEAIQERLDQLKDLRALREAKAADTNLPSMTLSEAKQRYGIE